VEDAAVSFAGILSDLIIVCPQCAQNPTAGADFWWLLGAMVLMPFPAVAIVVYSIRRVLKAESELAKESM
jgi:hypothetical protein